MPPANKADDPLGVILLFVITVIGAPLIEELFFRGFVQRGITSGSSRVVGVVATVAVVPAGLGLVQHPVAGEVLRIPHLVRVLHDQPQALRAAVDAQPARRRILRGQAGQKSALDLIYTLKYD